MSTMKWSTAPRARSVRGLAWAIVAAATAFTAFAAWPALAARVGSPSAIVAVDPTHLVAPQLVSSHVVAGGALSVAGVASARAAVASVAVPVAPASRPAVGPSNRAGAAARSKPRR